MNKKPIVLFDIDYTLFNIDLYKETLLKEFSLYKEVGQVLKNLSKFINLGIFSEGDFWFQKNKLINTDIQKYFEEKHTHIVLDKTKEIEKILGKYKDAKLFLIDDKATILHDVKKHFPSVFTVWVKRGRYAQNQKEIQGFKPDSIVYDLKNIVSIVKSKI